jgi:hypothetical protein
MDQPCSTVSKVPKRCRGRRFKKSMCVLFLFILPAVGIAHSFRKSFPDDLPAGSVQKRAVIHYRSGQTPDRSGVSLHAILAQRDVIPTHRHPLLGRPAPDFSLADVDGKVWHLRELAGSPVVLIFYNGFHCASCVRHLAELNSDLPLFQGMGRGLSPSVPTLLN